MSTENISSTSNLEPIYYKLNIEDLKDCKESDQGTGWDVDIGKNTALHVKFLWIQGVILEVHADYLLLKDSTGSCKVMASNSIQSSNSWISPDVYCAVLGQLLQTGSEPKIDAKKMTDISSNPILREMWDLEVKDLKSVLNGEIFPSLDDSDEEVSTDEA